MAITFGTTAIGAISAGLYSSRGSRVPDPSYSATSRPAWSCRVTVVKPPVVLL